VEKEVLIRAQNLGKAYSTGSTKYSIKIWHTGITPCDKMANNYRIISLECCVSLS